jgi:hypothetical protein
MLRQQSGKIVMIQNKFTMGMIKTLEVIVQLGLRKQILNE